MKRDFTILLFLSFLFSPLALFSQNVNGNNNTIIIQQGNNNTINNSSSINRNSNTNVNNTLYDDTSCFAIYNIEVHKTLYQRGIIHQMVLYNNGSYRYIIRDLRKGGKDYVRQGQSRLSSNSKQNNTLYLYKTRIVSLKPPCSSPDETLYIVDGKIKYDGYSLKLSH